MLLNGSIKVCDALCGFGKTTAAIQMMNNDNERRYIYVTQYLTEVERIKNACPGKDFKSPEHKISYGLRKLEDLHALLEARENIATTHSLFSTFSDQTLELLTKNRYVLILDEIIDVNKFGRLLKCDAEILKKSGVFSCESDDGDILNFDEDYDFRYGKFAEEAMLSKSNNLIRSDDSHFFWSFNPEVFKAFEDTYVLTYMFSGQSLKYYFELYGIDYTYIGVKREGDSYTYCPFEEMDRRLELRDKIHILEHKKLNAIGDRKYWLSLQWYKRSRRDKTGGIEQMRNNVWNYFKNIVGCKQDECLWTTYKDFTGLVGKKGFKSSFITYNKRACNEYANRKYLAYCINLFARPWEEKFFNEHGISVDSDMYALGYLIQWVFRSAIRKGEEVWLYIPSRRMRTLFQTWLKNLAEGHDLDNIEYKNKRISDKSVIKLNNTKGA